MLNNTRFSGIAAYLTVLGTPLFTVSGQGVLPQSESVRALATRDTEAKVSPRLGDGGLLAADFKTPPADARPWVYWFWLNGNITREGITLDLEAMARVGIGGVLIMEVDQGSPVGPIAFASPAWRELFKHACVEAARLGLQINMNDDAGWCGSGGPWIKPEQSMQKVVWSETMFDGPGAFKGTLAMPATAAGFYREIAVLAVPVPDDEAKGGKPLRIEGLVDKALYGTGPTPGPVPAGGTWPATAASGAIARERIVDVSSKMRADGSLAWEAPAGKWVIMRFGHTSTGAVNLPAGESGRGLECDKLSKDGSEAAFAGLMGRLVADVGTLAGPTLVSTHIDSWEVSTQNWTEKMREEFKRLRGYDPLILLPVMSGRVVDSLEISERFLWDLRMTVSDLIVENYARHTQELARRHGIRLSIEAYGEPADDMAYAGTADEPMCEFWSHGAYGAADTCTVMASAAHVYNKPILGAEAFTASDQERWRDHPGSIKAMGDWAFTEGINRFVFHRYAMQPWIDRRPGMTMGPWGLHYERTQTWWEQTRPWHEYLSRCQYLLRQGRFVADICYLAPEGSPQHFVPPTAMADASPPVRGGYNFDACPPEVILHRSKVENGELVLSDAMRYRVLVLPAVKTMTPELLRRVKELAEAGLTVIGEAPDKSPSLSGYPKCDDQVRELAAQLWGKEEAKASADRTAGRGKVIRGQSAEQVLAAMGVPPDFEARGSDDPSDLRYIHRTLGDGELYFVANISSRPVAATCAFRVTGARPEFWNAETGEIRPVAMYESSGTQTLVPLWLDPAESVFVMFRRDAGAAEHVVAFTHDGEAIGAPVVTSAKVDVQKATWGPLNDQARTKDVTAQVRALAARGTHAFRVASLAREGDPAYGVVKTLRVEYTVNGKPRVVSATDPEVLRIENVVHTLVVRSATYGVPGDATRTRDLKAKVQEFADRGEYEFKVRRLAEGDDPAYNVVKTLRVEYTLDGVTHTASATDPETLHLLIAPTRPARLTVDARGRTLLEASSPGRYGVRWSSGRSGEVNVATIPNAVDITGEWELTFPPRWGAPEMLTLPELRSWSTLENPGARYFSGTATYRKVFNVSPELIGPGKRVCLNLGNVAVIAEVSLNGRDLGTLWKSPYRVDITDVLKAGENTLKIRVTNLWPNRMIGDEQLPEDSDRNPDGTLKRWPAWLSTAEPSTSGRFTFTSWRLWSKDSMLLESGLIGPVRLEAEAITEIK